MDNELAGKNIIQGLNIKRKAGEKLDMVDIKHRMKLTEADVSRILNDWKALPKSEY